jgi:hypothetical protein
MLSRNLIATRSPAQTAISAAMTTAHICRPTVIATVIAGCATALIATVIATAIAATDATKGI